MFRRFREAVKPNKGKNLDRSFRRLGWIGFWIQVVVGAIPVALMIYFFTFARSATGPRNGLPFVEYLAIANLVILAFTTFWSYRYTRIGRNLADPVRRPAASKVISAAWTGVTASTVGMVFSMVVMLIEAGNLLFYFLKSPQAGVPIVQTSASGAASWVSAVDMVSLSVLILTLFGELIVLVFSLWLLFRSSAAAESLEEGVA